MRLRRDELSEYLPKLNKKQRQMQVEINKSVFMILCHMLREDLPGMFKQDMEFVLRLAPNHLNLMIQVAIQISQMYRQRMCPKNMSTKGIMHLIDVSQCIIQGLWVHDDPLWQLPYFDDAKMKKLKQKRKGKPVTIR